MMLVPVPMSQVHEAWIQVRPLLQKIADSAPDLTLSDLWAKVRSGQAELWVIGSEDGGHEAIFVVQLDTWKGENIALVIGAASNEAKRWRQAIPDLHAALKARGATKLVSEGRVGWERVWPGARVLRQVYEVDL